MTAANMSRIWEGERVAIFASGPSMSPEIAASIRGTCKTIAINNQALDCAPWADVIWASDRKWWVEYWDQVKDLPARKLMFLQGQPLDGVETLLPGGSPYDERPEYLTTGGNSGYAAICFAARLGAKQIDLHGYDMREVAGKRRRFDYPAGFDMKPRFNVWLKRFAHLAPALRQRGVNVLNCTPGSHLRCFPFEQRMVA